MFVIELIEENIKFLIVLIVKFLRLQMRLNEILNENKDLKGTSSLMERKVDDLTEENGVLSSQVCL